MSKFKFTLLALLLSGYLLAAEYKIVEVYANSVSRHQDIVNIDGSVVILYDKQILKAKSAIYNLKKKFIILKKDVTIFTKDGKRAKADTLKVYLDDNKIVFKDLFLIDKQHIWILAKEAKRDKNKIYAKNAIFSSCCVKNPDWSLSFKKAEYDLKTKVIKLNHVTVNIKNWSVFYLPYFYMPLEHHRKSGLLIPTFNYSKKEGFLYSQPIFWAISESQDLELDPQIRNKRGYGTYLIYRAVPSKDSYFKIKMGYFKDKRSFTKKYDFEFKKHYGVEAYYINNSVIDSLKDMGYENKLYFNGIYFNDIDYLNLQLNDLFDHHTLGSFYESRFNYFVKNNYFFTLFSMDYFLDSTKKSNKNTLQILPHIDFHIPYKTFIFNNLYYNFDFSITNYTRESGTRALKVKTKFPVELHFSLLDGYVNLNITEELESTNYDFYNVPLEQKKYSSTVLNHSIELSSELNKIYKSGIHTAFFSAIYTRTTILNERWMKYNQIPDKLKVDFVDYIPSESKITFRTHQYWHSFNNKLDINYILEAYYYPKESKLRNLEQEFSINYKNWLLYSKIGYSFVHSQTTEVYNKIGYQSDKYGILLSYLWKKDILSFDTITKEIDLESYYNYSSNVKYRAKVAYNIKDKTLKNWEIGTYLNRKCWSVDFSFGEDITPVIKGGGKRGSVSNHYFKVQFKLLPFGG